MSPLNDIFQENPFLLLPSGNQQVESPIREATQIILPLIQENENQEIQNEEYQRRESLFQKWVTHVDEIKNRNQILNTINELESKIKEIDKKLVREQEVYEGLLKKYRAERNEISEADLNRNYLRSKKVLMRQKTNDRNRIVELRNSLPRNEKKLSRIFKIQYQLSNLLKKDFPNKEQYLKFYELELLPLVQKSKQAIIQHPSYLATKAAAARGQAAQTGLNALKYLVENHPIINKNVDSSQEVILMPRIGVVYKFNDRKSKEEETIFNSLFILMSGQRGVESFEIQSPVLERFGMQIPVSERTRGFFHNELSSLFLEKIPNYLNRLEIITLKNASYFTNVSDPEESQNQDQAIFLTPDLSISDHKEAYEQCEKFRWGYKDEEGNIRHVDFKTLHKQYITTLGQINIFCISVNPFDQMKVVQTALNVKWKIITPKIIKIEDNQLVDATEIQAKPFINGMILLEKLSLQGAEIALSRIDKQSVFNAIIASELQMLDLHSKNLGLAPIPNSQYEYFKEKKFNVFRFDDPNNTSIPMDYTRLVRWYLNGEIKENDMIEFSEGEQTVRTPFNELADLKTALDINWKLVFFDADLSLSESNYLQFQYINGKKEHLVPINLTAFLYTKWKDIPFPEDLVNQLKESGERDLKVKQWISNEDAPIYKRLSNEFKPQLKELIAPYIEKYTLTKFRIDDPITTIDELRYWFASEISNIELPQFLEIWRLIENDLSHIQIKRNQTLRAIAKRYGQKFNKLKQLNPHLNPNQLNPGDVVKIHYDLTSPEAFEKRKRFAIQLFPRLTIPQQKALIERQESRTNYLTSLQKMKDSSYEGQLLINQLKAFINLEYIPLSSVRKQELNNLLEEQAVDLLGNLLSLSQLKDEICAECQPTFFNYVKSMYPLLADVFELNQLVFAEKAGMITGHYQFSIENSIAMIREKFPAGSGQANFAQYIEELILSCEKPAYFGSWE